MAHAGTPPLFYYWNLASPTPLLPTPDVHTTVWLTLSRRAGSSPALVLLLESGFAYAPPYILARFPFPVQGWLFLNSDVDFWQPAQMKAYLGAVRKHAHTQKCPNKKRTWGEAVLTQTTTVPRILGVAVAPSLLLRRCGSAWWVLFFEFDGQVPDDGMIVLGLASDLKPLWEFTDSYYGKPFIWCMLHNFGGNLGLTGRIDDVIARPLKDLANASSTMVGEAKNRKISFHRLRLNRLQ